MIIVALTVVFGIGGMSFTIGPVTLNGIGLAGITGVPLKLALPRLRPAGDEGGVKEPVAPH